MSISATESVTERAKDLKVEEDMEFLPVEISDGV